MFEELADFGSKIPVFLWEWRSCHIWYFTQHDLRLDELRVQEKNSKMTETPLQAMRLEYQMGRAGLEIYYGPTYYKQPFQS